MGLNDDSALELLAKFDGDYTDSSPDPGDDGTPEVGSGTLTFVSGKYGQAIKRDGAGSKVTFDGYNLGDTDQTISFFMSAGAEAPECWPVAMRGASSPGGLSIYFYSDGNFELYVGRYGQTTWGGLSNTDANVHYALTYTSATNEAKLYENGQYKHTATGVGDTPTDWDTNVPLTIGRPSDASGTFDTEITVDDLRVYSRILTPSEIQTLAGNPYAGGTGLIRVKKFLAPPSLKAGFARSASQSASPGLWREMVYAGIPFLGATGNTLHDISGYNRDGTLTNMEPGADWVVTKDGLVLDLDGADEFIELGTIPTGNPLQLVSTPYTIIARVMNNVTGDTFQRIVDKSDAGSAANGWALTSNVDVDSIQFYVDGTTIFTAEGTLSAGTWTSVAVTHDGGTGYALWQDGRAIASTTDAANTPDVATGMRVGSWNHDVAREWNGQIGGILIYRRLLSNNEISLLNTDLLSPFRLKPRTFSFPAEEEVETTTTLISVPRRAPPSAKAGYARSAGESKYPSLWNGMVNAYDFSIRPPVYEPGTNKVCTLHSVMSPGGITDATTTMSRRGDGYRTWNFSDGVILANTKDAIIDSPNEYTVLIWGWCPALTSYDIMSQYVATNDPFYMRTGASDGVTAAIDCRTYDTASALKSVTVSDGWRVNNWAGMVCRQAHDYDGYLYLDCWDGTRQRSATPAATGANGFSSTGITDIVFNNHATSYLYQKSYIQWNRKLTDGETALVLRDPSAPFRLRPRIFFFPAEEEVETTTTLISVPRRAKPSIKAGFARSAAESASPGLWRGLESAIPVLGVGNLADGSIVHDVVDKFRGTVNAGTWVVDVAAIEYVVDGHKGHCISLSSSTNDWIITDNTASSTMLDDVGSGEFTISLWVRETTDITTTTLISRSVAPVLSVRTIFSGTLRVQGMGTNVNDTGAINDGLWHHVVILRRGTNLYLYRDGQFRDNNTDSTTAFAGGGSPFWRLGQTNVSGGEAFGGYLKEVYFWKRALADSELRTLYEVPLAPFRLKPRIFSFPAEAPATTTTLISVPRRATPSFKTGFARSAAESASPGLWRGLEQAFPILGVGSSADQSIVQGSGRVAHASQFAVQNALNYGVDGERGYCFDFTTGTDHIQTLGGTNALFQNVGTGEFTISVWVRETTDITGTAFIRLGSPTVSLFATSGAQARVTGLGTTITDTSDTLNDGQWHHLVVVRRGTNCYIYRDGLARASNADSTGTISPAATSSGDWFIGAVSDTVQTFGGRIKEAYWYSRALSDAEIRTLYEVSLAPFRLKPRIIALAGEAPPAVTWERLARFRTYTRGIRVIG